MQISRYIRLSFLIHQQIKQIHTLQVIDAPKSKSSFLPLCHILIFTQPNTLHPQGSVQHITPLKHHLHLYIQTIVLPFMGNYIFCELRLFKQLRHVKEVWTNTVCSRCNLYFCSTIRVYILFMKSDITIQSRDLLYIFK